MDEIVYKVYAYEKGDGKRHIFEVFTSPIKGEHSYTAILDGAFLANAYSMENIYSEIKETVEWFNWTFVRQNKGDEAGWISEGW